MQDAVHIALQRLNHGNLILKLILVLGGRFCRREAESYLKNTKLIFDFFCLVWGVILKLEHGSKLSGIIRLLVIRILVTQKLQLLVKGLVIFGRLNRHPAFSIPLCKLIRIQR